MTKPLIFYDIPGLASPSKAWSPNTWKARLVLNMKGLPYKTVWVEYPDIAPLCERIGAERTSSAEPQYTLPVLQDPNTGAVVSDSFRIAQYLDETYPSTARAIPDGTEAFHKMFGAVVQEKVMIPLYHTVAENLHHQLAPRGQDYFRRTREELFGRKIEDIAPAGTVRDEHWRKTLAGLSEIHGWIGMGSEQKVIFVMGDVPSFADLVLVAQLLWARIMHGLDSKEWKEVMEADGGRWKRLIETAGGWVWVDMPGGTV